MATYGFIKYINTSISIDFCHQNTHLFFPTVFFLSKYAFIYTNVLMRQLKFNTSDRMLYETNS